jgi:hypothetical protein
MPDIAAVATQLSASRFALEYQAAVFNKMKEMQQIAGQAAIKLIESAAPQVADPNNPVGQNIDVTV